MLKKILIGVGVLVAVLVLVVVSRPPSYRLERSVSIAAPVEVLFPYGSDFARFAQFSPWENRDPNMQRKVEGEVGTVGHRYGWSGNDDVGEGQMTITEIQPNQRVTIVLEFVKPFPSKATTWMTFTPEGAGTKVAWGMEGELDTFGKAFSLFVDFASMVGKDYDTGLSKLKSIAEAEAKKLAEVRAAEEAAAKAAEAAQAGADAMMQAADTAP